MDNLVNKGMMRFISIFALSLALSSVQAAGVTVSNVSDDVTIALFDGTYGQSGTLDTVITLGLGSFIALDTSGAGAGGQDTLYMTLTAPDGFLIKSVTIEESGINNNTIGGISIAQGSLIADGKVYGLGTHIYPSTSGVDSPWAVGPLQTPTIDKKTVDVAIINSLTAFYGGGGPGQASVKKTSAVVTVGLSAVPVPPAIWMLGTAIAGLVTVGRRKLS